MSWRARFPLCLGPPWPLCCLRSNSALGTTGPVSPCEPGLPAAAWPWVLGRDTAWTEEGQSLPGRGEHRRGEWRRRRGEGPGTRVGQAHTGRSGGLPGHRGPVPVQGGLAVPPAEKLVGRGLSTAGERPVSEAGKVCSWSGHKGPFRARPRCPARSLFTAVRVTASPGRPGRGFPGSGSAPVTGRPARVDFGRKDPGKV